MTNDKHRIFKTSKISNSMKHYKNKYVIIKFGNYKKEALE